MKVIKVKFLKNGFPSGKAYTYRSEVEVVPGDMVQIDTAKKGIVVDEEVDAEWLKTYGEENLKVIIGKVEEECLDR